MSEKSKIKIGVVGCGRMGLIHAQNVMEHRETELAAIYRSSGSSLEHLGDKWKDIRFGDLDQFQEDLQRGQLAGVVIASPTESHVPLIRQCLAHQVPVLVEKPVSLDSQEIEAIEAESKSRGVAVLCAYQRRFDPAFVAVRQQLLSGKIGTPHLLILVSRDHPPPSTDTLSGGGSFYADFSTHDVDTAIFLLGEYPSRIFATASSFLPNYQQAGLHDTAVWCLQFPSGALCVINNSRRTSYGYDIRAELLGSDGILQVTADPHLSVQFSSAAGHARPVLPFSFPERFQLAYRYEFDHFVDLITQRVPLEEIKVSLADCARVALITQQASSPDLVPSQSFSIPQIDFPTFYDTYFSQFLHQEDDQEDETQEHRSSSSTDGPFLKKKRTLSSTSTTTSSSSSSSSSSSPFTGSKKLGVIIVGAGRMGSVRAAAVVECSAPQAIIKYVVDVHLPSAQALAAKYGAGFGSPDDLGTMLSDPQVAAVFISTVSSTHAPLIKQAVAAKKAIFVEKPLALTAAESLECLQAAKEAGVPIYIGFQRRSDPHRMETKRRLIEINRDRTSSSSSSSSKSSSSSSSSRSDGEGEERKTSDDGDEEQVAELIHVTSRDAPAHNSASYLVASGSFFFDSLIHDIDECCWFAGQRPSQVFCMGKAWIPEIAQSQDYDCVVIVLKFPNGTIAHIDNHRRCVSGYDQRVEVHSAAGMVQCGNEPRTLVLQWDHHGIVADPQVSNGILRYAQAYSNEVSHFLQLVAGFPLAPRITPHDALYGSYIAEAAMLSLKTGANIILS